jgi:GrpB-like predicted nucleotidyltransferase (UPF0157 family)
VNFRCDCCGVRPALAGARIARIKAAGSHATRKSEDAMYAMIELTEDDVQVEAPAYREPATELGILAYQAAWDSGFRAEAELLEHVLSPLSPHIEHVGTTAIPGSAARPIIDVLVGVEQQAGAERLFEILRLHGYRINSRAASYHGTRLLVRWQRGLPTHHVHVVEYLGSQWQQMLLFRDVLRIDHRLAREYEWLRRRFACLHPANRVAYNRAKATFIDSIVGQAH